MSGLIRELAISFRGLRRTPSFSFLVVLTLALGLAVNITMFSIVDGVLLEPLPLPEPDRVMRVWSSWPESGNERGTMSPIDLDDWRRQSATFSHLAAIPAIKPGGLVMTGEGEPAELASTLVTQDFFEVLGVPPLSGRTLVTDDQLEQQNRVVVLSEGFWRARFDADPNVVGRAIELSGEAFEVVGVMPARATYPTGTQVWAPVSLIPESGVPRLRQVRWMNAIGRLAPGVTPERAKSELSSIAARLATEYPDSNEGLTAASLLGLKEHLVGDVRQTLLVLYGAVGFVLLIVCANVASLLLTRAHSRQSETAVRRALGAKTSDLVRASLAEASILGVSGGVLGLAASAAALRYLPTLLASYLPPMADPGLDPSVVLYAIGMTLATVLVFGAFPAVRGAATDVARVLSDVARGSTAGRNTMLSRRSLVVLEIGVVVVLGIAAAVLVRGFAETRRIEPGFDMENVLIVDLAAPSYRYEESEQITRFYADLRDRLGTISGVDAVGVIRPVPMAHDDFGGESLDIVAEGAAEDSAVDAEMRFAGPGTFAALGIPLLEGREFDERDSRDVRPSVIINESLARALFPGERRVTGRRIAGRNGDGLEIAGVVGDVRHRHPSEPAGPAVYVSITQITRRGMSLAIRTKVPPLELASAVRAAIASVDPDQPVRSITTTGAIASSSLSRERLSTTIFSLFAAVALLIAVVGVSGTLGFTVAQRTREIGVRMAIGARPADVTRLVIREGLALAGIGVTLGVAGAWLLSGTLGGVVAGVRASELSTWFVVVAAVLLSATVASWLPARRAAALNPATAIRD